MLSLSFSLSLVGVKINCIVASACSVGCDMVLIIDACLSELLSRTLHQTLLYLCTKLMSGDRCSPSVVHVAADASHANMLDDRQWSTFGVLGVLVSPLVLGTPLGSLVGHVLNLASRWMSYLRRKWESIEALPDVLKLKGEQPRNRPAQNANELRCKAPPEICGMRKRMCPNRFRSGVIAMSVRINLLVMPF